MIVIGGFSVKEMVGEDPIFIWVRADDISGKPVIVQVLSPTSSCGKKEVDQLKEYFSSLSEAGTVGHLAPSQVLSDPPEHPLVVVYPDKGGQPLREALAGDPGSASRWWKQAANALHLLHVRKLAHGRVSLDSFVVVKGKAYLAGFGYAPLLRMGHAKAKEHCRGLLAPEVGSRGEVSPAADIYAFAVAVAEWKQSIKDSDWYAKATASDPSDRWGDARDAEAKLQGVLKPKRCTLTVTIEPKTAGSVSGGGSYDEGTEVPVEAKPKKGWRLEHWSGDLKGHENPATIVMDSEKVIGAHFAKTPAVLRTKVEPPGAGSLWVGPEPAEEEMELPRDVEVTIEVCPSSDDWNFIGWGQDATGTCSKVTVPMDSDKTVVARFEFVGEPSEPPGPEPATPQPIYMLEVKPEPRGAGRLTGAGRYQVGADGTPSQAVVEAVPKRGHRFDHWGGDLPADAGNPATLVMDANKTVTAYFVRTMVHVEAIPDPPAAGRIDGAGEYEAGSRVTLRATPALTTVAFRGWDGDYTGLSNPLRLTVSKDMRLTARFGEVDDRASIRNKVFIMTLGSPLTVCPLVAFVTGLMVIWTMSITSGLAVFTCIAGLMVNFGIFLSRLILGSGRLRSQAAAELEEERTGRGAASADSRRAPGG